MSKPATHIFPKRIPEPDLMHHEEMEAFEIASTKQTITWYEPILDRITTLSSKHQRSTILDVACGPGGLTCYLAERLPDSKLIGVDFSNDALSLAKKASAHLTNVEFINGNVEKLAFESNTFDIVVCKDSFHHFVHPLRVLKELERILKPGGIAYLQDLRRDMPLQLIERIHPPQTLFEKLQYYSARASYTIPEISELIANLKHSRGKVFTRHITKKLSQVLKTKHIDVAQLRVSFVTRWYCILKK